MTLTDDERRVLRSVDGNIPGGSRAFQVDSVIERILMAHEVRAVQDAEIRWSLTHIKRCQQCSESGHTCYPSAGKVTCPGEFCGACDYAAGDDE